MAKLRNEMTLAEYAAHRKCSTVLVHKKAEKGDIPRRMEVVGHRKYFFYDPTLCDAAWILNTNQTLPNANPNPPPIKLPVGQPSPAHSAALKTIKEAAKAQNPKQATRTAQNRSGGAETRQSGSKAEIDGSNPEEMGLPMRRVTAQVAKLEAEAARAQIELEQAAGKLAIAEDLEDLFASLVADARDRVLNLPPSMRAQFPELDAAVLTFVSDYIAGMLSALSKSPRGKNA